MYRCTNGTANEQPGDVSAEADAYVLIKQPDDVSAAADTNVVIEQPNDVPIEKWNLSKNLI